MHKAPEHHIALKTKEPLAKGMAGRWAGTIMRYGPAGIVVATDLLRGRELVNTRLYAIKGSTGHHYVVPLARDLTDAEVAKIAHAWDKDHPDGDFVINWSQDDGMRASNKQLQVNTLNSVVETAAKLSHNKWYEGMVSDGWSWAPKYSVRQKLHPNLRVWQDLPEKIKSRERDKFTTLLGVLEAMDLRVSQE